MGRAREEQFESGLMFPLEHCVKCSSRNIRAVLPEHCGKLGKLGKPP